MPSMKALKLFSHPKGPNPWKVAIILNELAIPYETEYIDFADVKKKPFTSINPNGRLPALRDENTDITLWESGAIIEYLIDNYDLEHHLSYQTFPEKYMQRCWVHFQMSGQGPYFGQKAWFTFFHPEKGLTSVIERYANEIRRVHGVIDSHLGKSGKPYLVGDKCTYADLMFVPWNEAALQRFNGPDYMQEVQETFPLFFAWHRRLMDRASAVKAFEEKAKLS